MFSGRSLGTPLLQTSRGQRRSGLVLILNHSNCKGVCIGRIGELTGSSSQHVHLSIVSAMWETVLGSAIGMPRTRCNIQSKVEQRWPKKAGAVRQKKF